MMRFFKTVIIMLVMFVVSPCYAVESLEEITLDLSNAKQMEIHKEEFEQFENNEIREEEFEHKKTLTEKLNDVYKLEISDTSKPTFLLNDVLTKHFEKGPLESIGVWGVWRGALNVSFLDKKTDTRMNYSLLESRIHGEFKNKKTSFVITTRYCPQDEYTFMQNLFSETVLKHKLDKHNTLIIGNNKTKAGQDGGTNIFILPFFSYSQIGRHFGNIRKLGVRLSGDYDLVEYDLGGYSSGTYFTEFFPGAEFCGWVTLKPLGKTDGRYGNLKIGGGLTSGRRHFNYNTVGGYIRYDYKRIGADFEIQNGDGYNGRLGLSSLHARGYYATLYYNLTKKIQLLARYDEFTPDCTNSSHKQREYSAGINYFIKGQGLKLILNYVFCQDSISKDSHKILIGTQVLL